MQTQLITSPKRICRAFRSHNRSVSVGYEDPMTQHYFAQEFVNQSCDDALTHFCRKTKFHYTEDCANVAAEYDKRQLEVRIAHRNPARLQYKEEQSLIRYHAWLKHQDGF